MRVLLTGAAHPLGVTVADALAQVGHDIRATDIVSRPQGSAFEEYRQGDLSDPGFVAPLLAGVGAIVHLAPLALLEPLPADTESEASSTWQRSRWPGETLDLAARGTHVLPKAAVEGAAGTG